MPLMQCLLSSYDFNFFLNAVASIKKMNIWFHYSEVPFKGMYLQGAWYFTLCIRDYNLIINVIVKRKHTLKSDWIFLKASPENKTNKNDLCITFPWKCIQEDIFCITCIFCFLFINKKLWLFLSLYLVLLFDMKCCNFL